MSIILVICNAVKKDTGCACKSSWLILKICPIEEKYITPCFPQSQWNQIMVPILFYLSLLTSLRMAYLYRFGHVYINVKLKNSKHIL